MYLSNKIEKTKFISKNASWYYILYDNSPKLTLTNTKIHQMKYYVLESTFIIFKIISFHNRSFSFQAANLSKTDGDQFLFDIRRWC